jgi:hypothetical protein
MINNIGGWSILRLLNNVVDLGCATGFIFRIETVGGMSISCPILLSAVIAGGGKHDLHLYLPQHILFSL